MTRPNMFERRIQVAEFDKQIAEMRLEHTEREKAQAEFQANWYENAPLSWLIRKTVHAFDRAVTVRMTKPTREVPAYDVNASVAISDKITAHDLHSLSKSYEQSVSVRTVGPTGKQAVIMRYVWLVYRIVRKVVKLVLRPIRSRRGAKA